MILRPGAIGLDALSTIAADVEVLEGAGQGASPGTALHHYATRTPLSVVESFDDAGHQDVVIRFNAAAPAGVGWDYPLGGDPVQAAHALYATLRSADTHDAQRILVEAPPRQEAWRAIADRLHRAKTH